MPITQDQKPRASAVIFDLDNTLWDWVGGWHEGFRTMMGSLERLSGLDREVLFDEMRRVHQRHGTTEYAFLIHELECLRRRHPNQDLSLVYAEVILARREACDRATVLYPQVLETLEELRERGCTLVGYTESMVTYTRHRVRSTGLDGVLDLVYAAPDHEIPVGLSPTQIRSYWDTRQALTTGGRTTPNGEHKPNPGILKSILQELGLSERRTLYVGDSLLKDVAMAQAAGVIDVHAEYGVALHREAYDVLRRVTHWTSEAVEKERSLSAKEITPSYVLSSAIGELVQLFDFLPPDG